MKVRLIPAICPGSTLAPGDLPMERQPEKTMYARRVAYIRSKNRNPYSFLRDEIDLCRANATSVDR